MIAIPSYRLKGLCKCGDITLFDKERECVLSMTAETFEKLTGDTVPQVTAGWVHCNSCANHWSVEQCGCGSGQLFGECEEDYPECRRPYQDLGPHLDPLIFSNINNEEAHHGR